MNKRIVRGQTGQAEATTEGMSRLAAHVVSRLFAGEVSGRARLREDLVVALTRAVCNPDPAVLDKVRADLRQARVGVNVLTDLYVPAVARRLGENWEEDSLSFADVTIGVARLQSMMREVGMDRAADSASIATGPVALVIVPQGEQHTLGAVVLAATLRRRGVSVCLRIAPSPSEIEALLRDRDFDGAFISVACLDRLEPLLKLVKTLREATDGQLRIALGGAVLLRHAVTAAELGVDCATNDIDEALAVFGVAHALDKQLDPV